jgi:hypothetical protein
VQQMIRNDGGKGEYTESTPPMLGIWNTLLKGEADATWVFLGWEGVEASMAGVDLNTFKLEDYKIPYGYSPLMVAHPDTLRCAVRSRACRCILVLARIPAAHVDAHMVRKDMPAVLMSVGWKCGTYCGVMWYCVF